MISEEMSDWTKAIEVKNGGKGADQKDVSNAENDPVVLYVFYDALDIGGKGQEEWKRTWRILAMTRNYGTTGIVICGMLTHAWD